MKITPVYEVERDDFMSKLSDIEKDLIEKKYVWVHGDKRIKVKQALKMKKEDFYEYGCSIANTAL